VSQERCCHLGLADPIAPASGQDSSELAQLPLDVGRHLSSAFSLLRSEATTFHPTTLQAISTAVDARLGDGQDVVSREALQPTQSNKTQASKPANPSGIHSLWVGLRAGAFMVRLASRAAQVRFFYWFGWRLTCLVGRPLDPSRLGLWVLRSAPHGLDRPQTIPLPFQLRAT